MERLFKILSTITCLILFMASCQKQEIQKPEDLEEFYILFYPRYSDAGFNFYNKDTVLIEFICYFSVDTPKLFINHQEINKTIENYGMHNYFNIPYCETIDYEIVVKDKILKGSYKIPSDQPLNIHFNGMLLLEPYNENYMTRSNNYLITWDKQNCNQYELYYGYSGKTHEINDTCFTFKSENNIDFSILRISVNYRTEIVSINQDSWKGEISSYFINERYIEFVPRLK